MRKVAGLLILGCLASAPNPADARVVRFVVERAVPHANGQTFGGHGAFERLEGIAYMEVDPRDPLNNVIVNLDKAPRNAKGLVEFSAPFIIIKPIDMTRGNQKILYGVNNRGNGIELGWVQAFPAMQQNAPLDESDGLMFRLGYTYVDAGWAGDVTTSRPRLGANLPVAVQPDGTPIVASVRIEYASSTGYTLPLKGNTQFRSYETADTSTGRSSLTVRDRVRGDKKSIPADRWAFGRCPTGQASLERSTTDICVFDGFDANRFYELIYPAKNPWVMGLGYAVTRDVASFLRYAVKDDAGNPNPLVGSGAANSIRRAYGLGTSSTGMYMRDYLYLGFNEDETHRKVFDAVRILIPGTHRLFANVEFSDPNVFSRQNQHSDFLSQSYPPLTYAVTTDPISGIRDGILKRPATDPLVFQVDTANEFWQMKASLNVHDGRGNPVPIPDNVRLYNVASHSHTGASGVAAMPTVKGTCEYPTNGYRSYAPVVRALLVALDEWADKGIAPPANQYPAVRNSTLVTREEAVKGFPAIPGVKFPTALNELELLNYDSKFGPTGGWLTRLPPTRGERYQVLVPKPNKDGIDVVGIKTVDIAVPVGTNFGWNLQAAGPRGMDLCSLSGSFIPFAKTKAERLESGDPRLSLEERYKDHAGFVKAVEEATRKLINERFLLEEDARTSVKMADASDILR